MLDQAIENIQEIQKALFEMGHLCLTIASAAFKFEHLWICRVSLQSCTAVDGPLDDFIQEREKKKSSSSLIQLWHRIMYYY